MIYVLTDYEFEQQQSNNHLMMEDPLQPVFVRDELAGCLNGVAHLLVVVVQDILRTSDTRRSFQPLQLVVQFVCLKFFHGVGFADEATLLSSLAFFLNLSTNRQKKIRSQYDRR